MPLTVECPGCGAKSAGVSDNLIGKKIRCKSCSTVFVVEDADTPTETMEYKPSSKGPVSKTGKSGASVASTSAVARKRRDAADAEEEDEKSKKKKEAGIPPAVLIGGGIAAVLFLLVGAGVLMYALTEEEKPNSGTSQAALQARLKQRQAENSSGKDGSNSDNGGTDNRSEQGDNSNGQDNGNSDPSNDNDRPKANNKSKPLPRNSEKSGSGDQPVSSDGPPPSSPNQPTKPKDPLGESTVNNQPGFESPPANPAPGGMTAATIEKVKKSTVYIDVTLAGGGGGSGSGWFCGEPGIIITNAHVVNMLSPSAREPLKVEVYLDHGLPTERKFDATVLGVDRVADLAVLRIKGSNLPPPLSPVTSDKLIESQPVSVVGYPLGRRLGKEVSVRSSSVSSFRRTPEGKVHTIQLEGGASPGNSGGPVVDMNGNVAGVLVAGIPGSGIVYCIPTEYVRDILNGRPEAPKFGVPYVDGDKMKLPYTVRLMDPMKRVAKAYISGWIGSGEPARAASDKKPTPMTGDTDFTERELNFDTKGIARGELVLPLSLPVGKVYWYRLSMLDKTDKRHWFAGTIYSLSAPPVEHRDANLTVQMRAAPARPIELVNKSSYTQRGRESSEGNTWEFTANLNEQILQLSPGAWGAQLQFQKMNWAYKSQGADLLKRFKIIQSAMEFAKDVRAVAHIDKNGQVKRTVIDPSRAPDNARNILRLVGSTALQSYEALSLPLPQRTVKVGETWETQQAFGLFNPGARNETQLTVLKTTYKYVGSRQREGREEAVIAVEGSIQNKKGKSATNYIHAGSVEGLILFDIVSQQITHARNRLELDLDLDEDSSSLVGVTEVSLKRTITGVN